jgi:hypothetical protein
MRCPKCRKAWIKMAALFFVVLVMAAFNLASPPNADAKEIYRGGFPYVITLEVEGNSVKATIVRSHLGPTGMKNPWDDLPEILSVVVSDPKNFTLTSSNEIRRGVYTFRYIEGEKYQVKFEPSQPARQPEQTYTLFPIKE